MYCIWMHVDTCVHVGFFSTKGIVLGRPLRAVSATSADQSALSQRARNLAEPPGGGLGYTAGLLAVPASYTELAKSHVQLDALRPPSWFARWRSSRNGGAIAKLPVELRAEIAHDVTLCSPKIIHGYQAVVGRQVQALYGLVDRWEKVPDQNAENWASVLKQVRRGDEIFAGFREVMAPMEEAPFLQFDRDLVQSYHLRRVEAIGRQALASAQRLLGLEDGSAEQDYLRLLWHGRANKALMSYLGFHYNHPFLAPWSTQIVSMPVADMVVQHLQPDDVFDWGKVGTLFLMSAPSAVILKEAHRHFDRFMRFVHGRLNTPVAADRTLTLPSVSAPLKQYAASVGMRVGSALMGLSPNAVTDDVSSISSEASSPYTLSEMLHDIFAPRAHIFAGIVGNLVTVSPLYSFGFYLPGLAMGHSVFHGVPLDLSTAVTDLPRMLSYTLYLSPFSYALMSWRLPMRVPGSAASAVMWQAAETANVPSLDNLLN